MNCESCGMPMEHGQGSWCQHCTNPDGTLQDFDERFERMVQWQVRREGQSRAEAEVATRAYMRTMPAWRDHPKLAP
ncbi:zinc ribbon domain-containing protein [Nonomuraea sp. NPDC050556]|uniref:zinc ribbon domain-containing protein n=1 Tax=Nonomuraea sp. NPDC050556 TaxID=3364369 RepID=UPI00378DDF5F